jgi:polysaccharide export outer membrane protein
VFAQVALNIFKEATVASTRVSIVVVIALMTFLPVAVRGQGHVEIVSNIGAERSASQSARVNNADRPVATERNPRYRINRDDILSLSFPLSPEFNQVKVTVQPDGYISLQAVGSLRVLGMTLPEAVEAVKNAYATTLHDPIVDIDLLDFQKPYFVVLGQVGKPGQYDLRYDMTATEALATAGGFSSTAKTRVYLYHRGAGGWIEAKELNLRDILTGKNVSEDVSMRSGDMIFVPEKTITKVRKYIPYGVGTYVSPSPSSY